MKCSGKLCLGAAPNETGELVGMGVLLFGATGLEVCTEASLVCCLWLVLLAHQNYFMDVTLY